MGADENLADRPRKMSLMKKMVIAVSAGFAIAFGFMFFKIAVGSDSQIWKTIYALLFANIESAEDVGGIGIFYIVGQLFMHGLQIGIVPLVFISLALAILNVEDIARLGRIARRTALCFLGFYAVSVTIAGLIGFTAKTLGLFDVELPATAAAAVETVESYNPLTIVLEIIPANMLTAFADNGAVLSIIFIAIVVGLCMHRMPEETMPFRKLLEAANKIVLMYFNFMIDKVSPVAILFMISRAFAIYGTDYLLSAASWLAILIVAAPILLFTIYPIGILLTTGLNPLPFIRKMGKVAILGAATQSSAAVLPQNMTTCVDELGCSREYSSFILPTGMTMHMNGTTLMQIVSIVFIATAAGIDIQPYQIALAALLSMVMAVATPAVPMAGVTLISVLMVSLGFTTDACYLAFALVMAINYPAGMAVMVMNVVGDTAVDVIVCKKEGVLDEERYNN